MDHAGQRPAAVPSDRPRHLRAAAGDPALGDGAARLDLQIDDPSNPDDALKAPGFTGLVSTELQGVDISDLTRFDFSTYVDPVRGNNLAINAKIQTNLPAGVGTPT
ncbi:hypothetical protein [Euzebya sp.]|uniref:hypothetical protein n=1 Tax=Euzebya sp. TaxID=1971409 RepID=UPI0035197112